MKPALSIDRLPSRRLFQRKPPRYLFHYTDLEAVKGILTSKSLWLSKFTSTNDISEIRLAIQHFQAFVEKEARHVGEDEGALLREAASRLETFRRTNVCLASFCEEDDLLSQWRAYGNDGRGIALGFSTPGLHEVARRHKLSLYRCVYDPKDQERIASDLVKLLLKAARGRNARTAAGRGSLLERFIALFMHVAPVIKDHRFGEEREWRLVTEALPYADRGMFPVLKGNQASVKYAIRLTDGAHGPSDVISRVTIGPTLDPYNVYDAIELLALRTGFEVKKVAISGIPFRLLPGMTDVLSLIGNTPLVQATRLDTGPCELYLKLENQNPGGSIKDRIGLAMIEAAERDARLKPGGTIVEATAGNTGLGLALVAARKGYRLILVIPDKMSQEKVFHLKAFGAEVVMTRSDVFKGHPDYYQDRAARIAAETPGAFFVNQFGNPANPLAHETTTAPEIWKQMDGRLDAVVCGVGSAGTITGLTRFFRRTAPHVAMVLADPEGSILAGYVKTGATGHAGSWLVEGIGEDFVPSIADLSGVKEAYSIPDRESFDCARELLSREAIFAGSSSGTLLAAALRYCRSRSKRERVVTFVCDSGNKYLSKMFNDHWLADQGFSERARHGDLRDYIGRPVEENATITVAPDDTLLIAYSRFKLYDVSQLPVLEGDAIVGLIDEYDVLMAVVRGDSRFADPVRKHMSTRLETVAPSASLDEVLRILDHGHVPIVAEGRRFHGLITRIDLLNSLRRQVR